MSDHLPPFNAADMVQQVHEQPKCIIPREEIEKAYQELTSSFAQLPYTETAACMEPLTIEKLREVAASMRPRGLEKPRLEVVATYEQVQACIDQRVKEELATGFAFEQVEKLVREAFSEAAGRFLCDEAVDHDDIQPCWEKSSAARKLATLKEGRA